MSDRYDKAVHALHEIAEKCRQYYQDETTEEPHEFARQVMRKAWDALPWLDEPAGAPIPLWTDSGDPLLHMIVFAGHVSPDECGWAEAVDEMYYVDDFGVETCEEAGELLKESTVGDYGMCHTWAIEETSPGSGLDAEIRIDDGFEGDGYPVTVFEEAS